MKVILPLLAAITCIFVLIAGKMQWNEKTKVTAASDTVTSVTNVTKPKATKQYISPELFTYIQNWPQKAQDSFKSAMGNGIVYKIAIVGSQALGDDGKGWASQLKEALIEAYGQDHIDVSIFAYDTTSTLFMEQHQYDEVVNNNANLILFEPFILNDNGNVTVEDNHQNILNFIKAVKKKSKKAVVILQPSNPLYQAKIYPDQVKQLQEFAKTNDIPYVDHWSVWPDSNTDVFNQYLDEKSNPNEKGSAVWFEFLKKYFIAQ